MIFSLETVRARKGDCLLLHYGEKDKLSLALIDGGPRSVYRPHLKPHLERIRRERGLTKQDPLIIDLLMVSHVDDDHIQGILDLTKDLIQDDPRFARVQSFWHNSFENVIGQAPDELTAALTKTFGPASVGGDPPDMSVDSDEDDRIAVYTLKALASINQGAQLRSDVINKLRAPLNEDFGGGLIIAQAGADALEMGNGLSFTVVGPMRPELKKLHDKHQAWLEELAERGLTAEDALSAYVDKSAPNLSSIVVLAEAGGKRMLLTGDARGDKILEGLELTGLVESGGKLHVDILKVPHHGSSRNLDNDFFERITADHYVFSGNGEHGNPERESLQMLLDARGDAGYTIHLTYPIDELDVARKEDWEKEQAKEKKRQEKKPATEVRLDWSAKLNSLRALFDENGSFAEKVSIVPDSDEAHGIDLLEPLNSATRGTQD